MADKVLVAMSGGVDSSVSVKLLLDEGYDVAGATMRLYSNEDIGLDKTRTCCSLNDVEDARFVAFKLGIDFHVFNFLMILSTMLSTILLIHIWQAARLIRVSSATNI